MPILDAGIGIWPDDSVAKIPAQRLLELKAFIASNQTSKEG